MKKRLTIKYFCLLILLTSCGDKYYDPKLTTFGDFQIEENITLDTIPINSEMGYGVMTYDSLLLVETGNNDGFVDIFSLNSYEKLTSICMIGRGNNEYIFPHFSSHFIVVENGNITLDSYNLHKFLYVIDLTNSIDQKSTIITKKEDLGEKFANSGCISKLHDGSYFSVIPSFRPDAREKGYNPLTYVYENSRGEKKEYTPFSTLIDDIIMAPDLYGSYAAISPDGKKAVNVYYFADYIDIIDTETLKVRGIKHEKSNNFKFFTQLTSEESMKLLYRYNSLVCATNDLFINLYNYNNIVEEEVNGKRHFSTFRIFDWDGTPLIKLNTEKTLLSISYNEQQRAIYCIDDKSKIYKYNLDEVLKKVKL